MGFEGKSPRDDSRNGGRDRRRDDRDRQGAARSGGRAWEAGRGKGGSDRKRQGGRERKPWHQGGRDRDAGSRRQDQTGDDRGNSRGGWKQGRPKLSGTDGNRGSRVPRDSRNDRGERRDFREGRGDRRDSREGRRDFRRENPGDEREKRVPKPGTAPAQNEPPTPDNFDESMLPASVRAELKGLPKDLANTVGAHILAAGELLDVDPELAYRHAEAARRRAGRLPVVREAAAETAYVSGHYDIALREFRAIRRMNGGDELLPVLADCERALGRHREALELLASLDPGTKKLGLRIECILVEAGIRSDLGQRGEAMRLLKAAISHRIGPKLGQARLRYAYADLLESEGRLDAAREWFESAARMDPENQLEVTERLASLDGITLPEDFDLEPVPDEEPETVDEKTEVVDMEDAIETQVIDLVSPEEEIAEVLAEIDGSRE